MLLSEVFSFLSDEFMDTECLSCGGMTHFCLHFIALTSPKLLQLQKKRNHLFYFSVLNKFNKFVAEISVHHYYTLSLKGKEKHAQSVFVFENESQSGLERE